MKLPPICTTPSVQKSDDACRHGFATGLLDQGVSPVKVAKRGGWKSAQHVFATYGHDVADDNVTDILTGTKSTRAERKRNAAN